MRQAFPLCFALAAMLALAACSGGTRYVPVGGPAGDPAAEARAMAAEAALAELRASLATAQEALAAGTTAQQRTAARAAVDEAQEDLDRVREDLVAQPASAARTAAEAALAAVGTALERTAEALTATDGAMASGAGLIAFDDMHTSLARAENAIRDAQRKLKEALAAEPDTALRNLLTQAQGTLSTAQISLLPLLREDLADAEQDLADVTARASEAEAELARLTLAFGKDLGRDGREASRVAPADDAAIALTPRRDGVEWRADTGFEATSPSWSTRTRYTITDYGTADANRLAIRQDAVPWTAASGMVIPGASGDPATAEFPGRGQVFRAIGYDHEEFVLPRQGSYGPASDGTAATAIPRFGTSATGLRGNLRGHAISSFQYRETGGLTMKFGGMAPDQRPAGAPAGSEGSLIYGDLEALTAKGTYDCGTGTQACDEAGTRDLTVSFGAPSRDPTGDPAYYWTVDVPDPRLTIAAGTTATAANPAALADEDGMVGRYEALLSNHAGVAADDSERYLRYAAYGLFQFIDYQTERDRVGRMQTFHYGFDAFGTHNPLPAATADSIAATFKGRTMAWLATTHSAGVVGGLERMRGNVTLHACIGGSGCQASAFDVPSTVTLPSDAGNANKITGAIHDLEITLPGGAWGTGNTASHPSGYYAFLGDVLLDGTIDNAGAFSGTAVPDSALSDSQRGAADGGTRTAGPDTHGYTIREQVGGAAGQAMAHYWRDGQVEGVFYGPAAALEAAGTWWLPATNTEIGNGVLGIVGSFGAVACPADDSNC